MIMMITIVIVIVMIVIAYECGRLYGLKEAKKIIIETINERKDLEFCKK